MSDTVLVRAIMGEPLKRVVVNVSQDNVYVSKEDLLDAVNEGKSNAVAFPKYDVFQWDEGKCIAMMLAWPDNITVVNQNWDECTLYDSSSWVRKV